MNSFFSSLLLIFAVVTLGLGFRTFRNPIAQRCSVLCLLLTSFLVGYLPTGNYVAGGAAVLFWVFLPWLEILTRIRRLRLPRQQDFRHRVPPNEEKFPHLEDLTSEVEALEFEHVADVGYDWDTQQQFLRLFHRTEDQLQAAICLISQPQIAFYYVSLMTRAKNGSVYLTWNYPFSYSLKLLPNTVVHRIRNDTTIEAMTEAHRTLLAKHQVKDVAAFSPEQVIDFLQSDLEAQIDHNVRNGLLAPAGQSSVRYTWRGFFFLWVRFLSDFVRL